ncbi:MAG: carboxypeptidase regulatory-like domain-containing protein [Nitrospirae bacterium]|nr:carboxypeptidase regulatory-like domain-containing protein [Nitrospirota bacterium]
MQSKTSNQLFIFMTSCFLAVFLFVTAAPAGEKSILKGRVLDMGEKAVEAARIFVYNSPEIRRPSDFISANTDKDGRFHMFLPPGKYWAVARLKKTEGYGPLMPGDKHSGEAKEIVIAPGMEFEMDFTVSDLKEASRMKKRIKENYFKINGRIINEKGLPVRMAYVFANRNEKVSGVPDYLSAWTDEDGHYTLYLPKGRYYMGAAVTFPPGQNSLAGRVVFVESDKVGEDIVNSVFDNK